MEREKRNNIIYVNFAPYENAGNILDFLLNNFETVFLFRFNFHQIDNHHDRSVLQIFYKKKIIKEEKLFYIPVPTPLAFILIPIRSIIIFFQLLYYMISFKRKYGTIETFFSVNAFTSWCGNIFRDLGLTRQSIFWVWDYYPPVHNDLIIRYMRFLYWWFDKKASLHADRVIFLNERLKRLRQNIGITVKKNRSKVVGIGTNPIYSILKKSIPPINIAFVGVIKKSQGLELFLEALRNDPLFFKHIKLHIIGGGPDEQYMRSIFKIYGIHIIFHGFICEEKKVSAILNKCHIGIAPYYPEPGNVSYFGDPSKIKLYLSHALPVITTNVFSFSKEIKKTKAGIVIPYSAKELKKAISMIRNHYSFYQKNAFVLSQRFAYKKIYKDIFASLRK